MPGSRRDLAARRKSQGFTQESLAHAIGVDRTTVARWEAGETELQPWLRRKLMRFLEVSADELTALLRARDIQSVAAASRPVLRSALTNLEQLQATLDVIDSQYETAPSAVLLAEAGRCHASAVTAINTSRSATDIRCLHLLAARSAMLLSQLK